MFFASFLPLGSGLITVPISILLLLSGNVFSGLGLLAWHIVVVSSIDNIVRAKMFEGGIVNLPEMVTFITTLGGVILFGFFGIIYGPLIAIAFLTMLDFYQTRVQKLEEQAALSNQVPAKTNISTS